MNDMKRTPSFQKIIVQLMERPLTIKQICDRLSFSPHNTSMALNQLKNFGYIKITKENKKDMREKTVQLTQNGKMYAESINLQKNITKMTSGVFRMPTNEDEREAKEAIINGLKKLNNLFRRR